MWATVVELVKYCDRWKHVELALPASMIFRLSSIRHRLPWLESLHFNTQGTSGWPLAHRLSFFQYAPRLCRLSLPRGMPLPGLEMPWVQLTEFEGFFENIARLQTLQLVLNLVKCTLHCDAWNSQFHSSVAHHVPKVHFPKLLFLRLNITGIPTDLFNHLEVPILHAIHINAIGFIKHKPWISGQFFVSFLSCCSDTLRSLSLKGPSNMNRYLDAIASPTPLKVVDFHGCVAGDILGRLVFPLPGAKSGSCLLPELEVLELGSTTKNLQLLADVIQS